MRTGDNRRIFRVSELTQSVRVTLEERFALVWVEGEMSNLRRPGSGHWYFTLKDERAQLRCAMFANRSRFIRFRPMDGMRVVARGRLSLFEPRGDFQLIAEHLEPAGEGELRAAFETLRARLDAEGLFAADRKVALPCFPRHVAIITSASGAAIRDVVSVFARRSPTVELTLIPVSVQGKGAEREIIAALSRLTRWPEALGRPPDAALITRGGGSLEDLWVFNLESVARAIADCPVPIISAVGHETDFTIADFVADERAPTPSAGAELIAPDLRECVAQAQRLHRTLASHWQRTFVHYRHRVQALRRRTISPVRLVQMRMQRIDGLERAMAGSTRRLIARRSAALASAHARLGTLHPRVELARRSERLARAQTMLERAARRRVQQHAAELESHARALHAVSPLATLDRGYAVLTEPPAAGSHWGRPVSGIGDTAPGARLVAHLRDGRLNVTVENIDVEGR